MHEHPLAAEILWFSPKFGHGAVTVELSMATPGRMGAFYTAQSPLDLRVYISISLFPSDITI